MGAIYLTSQAAPTGRRGDWWTAAAYDERSLLGRRYDCYDEGGNDDDPGDADNHEPNLLL